MDSSDNTQVIILDATAFYAGIPYSGLAKYYTTDSVVREISHRKKKITSVQDLIETGKLKIYDPVDEYLQIVENAAHKTGDVTQLSKTDISIIALALEFKNRNLKVTLISDDYSVENLANKLGIFTASVSTEGIKKIVEWKIYCGGCGKIFKNFSSRICDVCGSTLKRKFNNENVKSKKSI
jgi:UPF0271 protein